MTEATYELSMDKHFVFQVNRKENVVAVVEEAVAE